MQWHAVRGTRVSRISPNFLEEARRFLLVNQSTSLYSVYPDIFATDRHWYYVHTLPYNAGAYICTFWTEWRTFWTDWWINRQGLHFWPFRIILLPVLTCGQVDLFWTFWSWTRWRYSNTSEQSLDTEYIWKQTIKSNK